MNISVWIKVIKSGNIQVKKLRSTGRDIKLFSYNFFISLSQVNRSLPQDTKVSHSHELASCYHKIICHSHKLVSHGNEILSLSNEMLSCGNEILSRWNEMVSGGNEILTCGKKILSGYHKVVNTCIFY